MPDAKTLLALDTSGPWLQLALFRNGRVNVLERDVARGHAEILFGQLEEFLAARDIGYRDLDALAVTTGPGSFTGLRIGIAAARGLGLALGIGVIGIPNLLALSLERSQGAFSILLDARRGQFYLQEFVAPGDPSGPPRLLGKEDAHEKGLLGNGDGPDDPRVDIARLARFAAAADPTLFPPRPTYVRPADAKPQTTGRIARQG